MGASFGFAPPTVLYSFTYGENYSPTLRFPQYCTVCLQRKLFPYVQLVVIIGRQKPKHIKLTLFWRSRKDKDRILRYQFSDFTSYKQAQLTSILVITMPIMLANNWENFSEITRPTKIATRRWPLSSNFLASPKPPLNASKLP